MRRLLLIGLLLSAPVFAAPNFRPKNGQSVRVRLGDKRESGFGLRPAGGEWRLELGRGDVQAAEIVDVTSGSAGMKWLVSVDGSALRLEDNRFRAGHAYRVELSDGRSALVYLYPPKAAAHTEVQFDERDSSPDGEMATLPKPTL